MKRWHVFLLLLCAVVLLFGAGWWAWQSRDPMLQGKRHSEWIGSIDYNGDEAQTERWRSLGPEGVRLLGTTLDRGRTYRRIYRKVLPRLPGPIATFVVQRLPNPVDAHRTRMNVISLLNALGKDALPAEPAIARALEDDDEGVRMIAIACYEVDLLERIGPKARSARLPSFLHGLQDRSAGIRNNAAVALRHYGDHASRVVPALMAALKDPKVGVRLQAAQALVAVDLEAAVQGGVVEVATEILEYPDDQVAHQGAQLLEKMGRKSELAVPALLRALDSPSGLTATAAASALGSFPDQREVIVPALMAVLNQTNSNISRWGPANALNRLDPAVAGKAGLNR